MHIFTLPSLVSTLGGRVVMGHVGLGSCLAGVKLQLD